MERPRSTPLPNLAQHRRRRGVTQRQLGELAGVAHTTVQRLESLNRGAYPRTLRKLATALGVELEALMGIWGEQLLPVRWETVEVALRDAFRIRRVYRKLAKRKSGGPISRITVFVRHESVVRLLGFLGYRLERSTRRAPCCSAGLCPAVLQAPQSRLERRCGRRACPVSPRDLTVRQSL